MKKSILLGAAALAAVTLSAPQSADAGEVKLGGYYMFRMTSMDNTPAEAAGVENANYWAHRLQLNLDMKASEKSHAHMVYRAVNNQEVSGADATVTDAASATNVAPGGGGEWTINQLWLETEAWGVGVKVGNMPLAVNDGLLLNNDTTSYGAVVLSKNFGGTTLVLGNVKVAEGAAAQAQAVNINHMDVDIFMASLLGKLGTVDYQFSGAYLNEQTRLGAEAFGGINGTGAKINANDNIHDGWLALTLSTKLNPVELTGTIIYETGMDNVTDGSQLEEDGFLAALRLKGKTGFGGWNAYAFYASEDFTSAVPGGDLSFWSPTWDQGGPGSHDLMKRVMQANTGGGYTLTTTQSNVWGVGAGLSINAGAWTIKPSLDYAQVVEEAVSSGTAVAQNVTYDHAWGGTLGFSTKIQEGTTLDISGTLVDPNLSGRVAGTEGMMHYVQASLKLDF